MADTGSAERNESDDKIRERIHRRAAADAEATVYSLNNPYLNRYEKATVEAVYQFPMGVFSYSFALFALASDQTFWRSFVLATVISSIAWLFARFLPARIFNLVSIAFTGSGLTIITLFLAVIALWEHHWAIAGFLILAAFGLTAFVEAPLWLWTITSPHMNAKYAIAKRAFGVTFPFEAELRNR